MSGQFSSVVWEEMRPDELRIRRAAVMRQVEASLPALIDEDGNPLHAVLSRVHRIELDPVSNVRLIEFLWKFERPALPTKRAQFAESNPNNTDEPEIEPFRELSGVVLVGPAAYARLCNAPNGMSTRGGDDLSKFLSAFAFYPPRACRTGEQQAPALSNAPAALVSLYELLPPKVFAALFQPVAKQFARVLPYFSQPSDAAAMLVDDDGSSGLFDAPRLGFAVTWQCNPQDAKSMRQLAFDIEIVKKPAEWAPADLRGSKSYEAQKDLIEALIAGSSEDGEAVRKVAEAELARRQADEPWHDLVHSESTTAVGRSFCETAQADLMGFEPPSQGDPVVVRARRLPFYERTDLIDMIDRRSGYPRNSRFMAKYETGNGSNAAQYRNVMPIDWKSQKILDKNARENLKLKPSEVYSYLDFFCQYIVAEGGYFRIAETPESLTWLSVRKRPVELAQEHIQAIELWTDEPVQVSQSSWPSDRWFLARAKVVYARSLYAAVFAVSTNGHVRMIHDDVEVNRLPIVAESLSRKTHFIYLANSELDR